MTYPVSGRERLLGNLNSFLSRCLGPIGIKIIVGLVASFLEAKKS